MDSLEWPVPPPFMRNCVVCHALATALVDKAESPVGCFAEQVTLARHIVRDHPDRVPEPHTDGCALCPDYAKRNDGDPAGVWAEHRTRDLFMPTHVARLM
ncbi:hypothetical protein ACGF7W_19450 [Streptomyces sp. NPDC048219]|uniref:hypothetical protein n=1 Tax=Streptomyces sp. NPDC048219 TaxID=3365517 RepID=UPI00371061CF